jgi:thioredoxin 1
MAFEFTDVNFKKEALETNKLVVVDLWAEWCGPCKMMGPVIDELATEYADKVLVGKLDVDANSEVPTNYHVRGIPTFLFIKNGELVDKEVGAVGKKKLEEKILKYM